MKILSTIVYLHDVTFHGFPLGRRRTTVRSGHEQMIFVKTARVPGDSMRPMQVAEWTAQHRLATDTQLTVSRK